MADVRQGKLVLAIAAFPTVTAVSVQVYLYASVNT